MRIIRLTFISTLCLLFTLNGAWSQSANTWNIGLEQDVLPYLTGGYYGGVWVGKGQLRARALVAHVHKPALIVPDGFTNNVVTAYALVADYFLKPDWAGWWLSGGVVLWDSSIQSDLKQGTAQYTNVLLNGSLGYSWKFYRHFYLSPWAGMHIRLGGVHTVTVDGASFQTPIFNPEASLKIGWYF